MQRTSQKKKILLSPYGIYGFWQASLFSTDGVPAFAFEIKSTYRLESCALR